VGNPHVVDHNGQERDWDWLVATFGEVGLDRAESAEGHIGVYRIVRLEAATGPSVLTARVIDQNDSPLTGIQVARHWPDAPELPYVPAPASLWHLRGILGTTGAQGEVGFVTGVGDDYSPPDSGASSIWVADPGGPSDLVRGLGMLAGTQHLHLNIVFQHEHLSPPDPGPEPLPPPPPDPPADDQWEIVFGKLDLLIRLLEERLSE
jgi:hypothetical protein